ncbi:hypothetical protein SEEV1955_11522 [Salmonella enterica subsp. enterica serovar Virchow str. ATCC 51955]|nr:hypothetical protein SEEV1955_11522 [Salmonella enterica subsp. enterica serovar Virchow str. ATCC 51955]
MALAEERKVDALAAGLLPWRHL